MNASGAHQEGCHSQPGCLRLGVMLCAATLALVWAEPLRGEPPPSREAAATVVVYNDKDPDSVALAGLYAKKRGIPFTQLAGIEIEPREEITRDEFDLQIQKPLRDVFTERGWWRLAKNPDGGEFAAENKMRFMVLMRGVPLKIAAAAAYPGDQPAPAEMPVQLHTNAASVDSELSLLGFHTRVITGPAHNPYYQRETPFLDAALPGMLLVCRLDAADVKTVRRMMDDALEAERVGLWGFCYADMRGLKDGGLVQGDRWIQRAAADAQKAGLPVILDNGGPMFPDGYPMRHAALYYGWYSADIAGPLARPGFAFQQGAIAAHIHSFSAATLRNPRKGWVAPLLDRGAAATLGNVYEPLLALTADLEIFQKRLGEGFTFAEAGYASLRGLSWMTVFVGDPLYRPFPSFLEAERQPQGAPAEWVACRDGLRAWQGGKTEEGRELLSGAGKRLRAGAPFETLGLLEAAARRLEAAFAAFAEARKYYDHNEDVLRTWIHQVNLLRFNARKQEALKETRRLIKKYPAEPATAVLRMIENQLAPPPPTPVPPGPAAVPKR